MLQPGDIVADYEIERLLGEGGTAAVYAVTHRTRGTRHALKVLSLTHSTLQQRLLREGRLQAALRHPHVVGIDEVLHWHGVPVLVLELIDGPSLDDVLAQGPPPPAQAERWFREILAAVAHAHDNGAIHRDLKPANVLLADVDGKRIAKVADFGLAKALDSDTGSTRTGLSMGTPQYMAPEQVLDAKHVDHRADLFSLGCLLYELFAGESPYVGRSLPEVFDKVRAGTYPPLPALTPPHIRQAVARCLVVDREARIGSCAELLAVLDATPAPASPALPPQLWWGLGTAGVALLGTVVVSGMLVCGLWWFVDSGEVAPVAGDGCAALSQGHVGWAWARRRELDGHTFTPRSARNVRTDYPRQENGFDARSPGVCVLPPGTVVTATQLHTMRGGAWVDVRGAAIEPVANNSGKVE